MHFVFQFVPIRFALLSCIIYLALIAGLAMTAAFVNVVVFKNWGGQRSPFGMAGAQRWRFLRRFGNRVASAVHTAPRITGVISPFRK